MTAKANLGRKATYVGPSLVALPSGSPVVVISLVLGAAPLAVVQMPSGHSMAIPYDQVVMSDERT